VSKMRKAAPEADASEDRYSLYLVRHAIAEERGDKWPDDTKRPLTKKGRARMGEGARGLQAFGVTLDLVLTSPLVRARQTADILVAELKSPPKPVVTETLAPDRAPADVANALAPHARAKSIALVGHEPDLGELAAWLIGAKAPLEFRKGGVCRIDSPVLPPRRNCRLIWFATPKMLRELSKTSKM
jgi:phosphohistidine phosphatase